MDDLDTALDAELLENGGGGGAAATFFLHPLNVPHSTVTAKAAKNRDFMKKPPIVQDTKNSGVSNIPSKQYTVGRSGASGKVSALYRIDAIVPRSESLYVEFGCGFDARKRVR